MEEWKKQGRGGGRKKNRALTFRLSKVVQRDQALSLCRACNKLLLIKQLFSFSVFPVVIRLSFERKRENEMFPYANKKLPRFFFFSFEKRRQQEVSALWKRCQMSTEEKRVRVKEKQAEFPLLFARDRAKRLSSYVSHVTPSTNYVS